jgi:hypothetical protein
MKEFDVTITEKLQTVVTVEANTKEEAEQMVSDQWRSGDHILDADNFVDVEFEGKESVEREKEKTIDVLLVEPGQYPRMTSIGSDLHSLQKAVGGDIEAIYPYDDPIAIVCAEEGKINGEPLNRAIRDEDNDIVDIIAGTFFVCGLGEEDFASLPKELQEKYEDKFHQPESFLKLGSRIMAIPMEPAKQSPAKDKSALGEER